MKDFAFMIWEAVEKSKMLLSVSGENYPCSAFHRHRSLSAGDILAFTELGKRKEFEGKRKR